MFTALGNNVRGRRRRQRQHGRYVDRESLVSRPIDRSALFLGPLVETLPRARLCTIGLSDVSIVGTTDDFPSTPPSVIHADYPLYRRQVTSRRGSSCIDRMSSNSPDELVMSLAFQSRHEQAVTPNSTRRYSSSWHIGFYPSSAGSVYFSPVAVVFFLSAYNRSYVAGSEMIYRESRQLSQDVLRCCVHPIGGRSPSVLLLVIGAQFSDCT